MSDARLRNLEFVYERCSRCGIDGPFAARRLDQGSFCLPQQKLLYVVVPKAACTTVKHMLLDLLGRSIDVDLTKMSARESTMNMLVHHRGSFPCPSLLDLEHDDLYRAVSHADGWMTLAVVRNPLSRIVSFFNDKIRKGEPGYLTWHERYIGDFSDEAAIDGFRRFVADLNPQHISPGRNAHLVKQIDLLLSGFIDYSDMIKMENFSIIEETIGGRFPDKTIAVRHLNRASSIDWRRFYDERTAAKVAGLYDEDFNRLGYSTDDWKSDNSVVIKNREIESSIMKDVFERNRMIEHLYGVISSLNTRSSQ